MIVVIVFHMTSTNLITLYYPLPFGSRIMVVQISYDGTLPSWNVSCAILIKASHMVLSGFFSCVASLRHIFICSA